MPAAEGSEPPDRDRDRSAAPAGGDKPLWGTTPGQTISRVLLLLGLLLMLWVVFMITRALS